MKKAIISLVLFVIITHTLSAIDFQIKGISIAVPKPSEVNEFCDFIENDLGPSGVNTILLRVDYNFKFQSYPQVASDSAISLTDAQKIVTSCNRARIVLVPLMEMLGHQGSAWGPYELLEAFPEFDETPWVPYATATSIPDENGLYPGGLYKKSYCPSHPEVHRVTQALIGEVIDAFQARIFSPAMDEVLYIGECDRCKTTGKSNAELFAGEANRINAFVNSKNAQMWIWGDRLLQASEWGLSLWGGSMNNTWQAVDLIDKNITILDWHYTKSFVSPVFFATKGLNVISCPAGDPKVAIRQLKNLVNFQKDSYGPMFQRYKGFIVTHWGVLNNFITEFRLEKNGLSTNLNTSANSFFSMLNELRLITKQDSIDKAGENINKTIYVSELGNNANEGSMSNPVQSLNRAINLSKSGDTIKVTGVVIASGITLTNGYNLVIEGEGPDVTFLQPSSAKELSNNRVFNIVNAGNIVIKNITIRWGNSIDIPNVVSNGGNIYIENSALTLENVIVQDGKAYRGGGIYINGTRNSGGAKHHFTNTLISNNQSTAGSGGGLFVTSNRYNVTHLLIEKSTISNNRTQVYKTLGGGLFVEPYKNNTTQEGKACNITVLNSTFYGNQAANGAGIATGYVDFETNITLINNTIAFNNGFASDNTEAGSAGISVKVTPSITFTLINNIISMNKGRLWGKNELEYYDMSLSGVKLSQADCNIFTNELAKHWVGQSTKTPVGNLYQDNGYLLLADTLLYNGGITQNLSIAEGSIAINAGINHSSIKEDQRGINRDGVPDIGAYEFTSSTQLSNPNAFDSYYEKSNQTIQLNSIGYHQISIYDLTGKKVMSETVKNDNKLNVRKLESNKLYFAKIMINGKQQSTLKFIR
jgi:hypothetical protein